MAQKSLPEFKGNARFVVERCEGTGGFGVVYKVFDKERSTIVALKTLNKAYGETLLSFKQEFRALADVTHPNLVALYDLLWEDEQWFFTMEYIDGVNFLEYVAIPHSLLIPEEDPTTTATGLTSLSTNLTSLMTIPRTDSLLPSLSIDLSKLRSALHQLVEGVQALHEAGKLHRDLKPSNVLVTPRGRVVILDFGLVTDLIATPNVNNYKIVGTPAYMSPEQGSGRTISAASDWYSVGVILYEALTGELPFGDHLIDRPMEIIINKQRFDPSPPSSLVKGVPEDLEQLCLALLNRNPANRPHGEEILSRLAGWNRVRRRLNSDRSRRVPFIGREFHLQQMRQAFEQLRPRQGQTILITGQAGFGKTSLIRHFFDLTRQTDPQAIFFTGRCYEQESMPYKALDSLVDRLAQYLGELPQSEVQTLLPASVAALAKIFPVLNQVRAIAQADPEVLNTLDSFALRHQAFLAFRQLLHRLAHYRRLVIFIDDLQWGDADSASLITEVLQQPPPFLLLLAYRSEEAEHSPFLNLLIPLLTKHQLLTPYQELTLEALPLEQSIQLANHFLRNSSRAETLAHELGGNPFFICELAQYAASLDEQINVDLKHFDQNKLLDKIIRIRLQEIPVEARQILEFVAVAGQRVEHLALKRAVGLEIDDWSLLNFLRRQRFIRLLHTTQDYLIDIYNDRIGKVVLVNLSLESQQLIYRRLATTLEELAQGDPPLLVFYFQKAGDLDKAMKYAVAAAQKAEQTLAFEQAATLYQQFFDLWNMQRRVLSIWEFDEYVQLQIKFAQVLANTGRGTEAAQAYQRAASHLTGNQATYYQQLAAEQLLRSGHIDEGLELTRNVLQAVGLSLSATPQQALLSVFMRRAWLRVRGLGFQRRQPNELSREEMLKIDIFWSLSIGFSMVDVIRAGDFLTRHLLITLKTGEVFRVARALTLEIGYSAAGGQKTESHTQKLITLATNLAITSGNPQAMAYVNFAAMIAKFLQGHWQQAYTLAQETLALLRQNFTDAAWELATTHVFMLRPLFYTGDLLKLRDCLPELLQEAQTRGDLYAATGLRTRLYYLLELADDDDQSAQQNLQTAIERWSQKSFYTQHYWETVGQIEVALYQGDGIKAAQIVQTRWPLFVQSLLLRIQFIKVELLHLRANATLALANQTRNLTELLPLVEKSIAKIEAEGCSWGNLLAQLLRTAMESFLAPQQAIVRLTKVIPQLQAADMLLWAMAAQRRQAQLMQATGDVAAGEALQQLTDQWFAQQKIQNPARLTAMLLPGNWLIK